MKTMNSAYGTSYLHLFDIWFRYSPPLPPSPPPIHLIFASNFSLVTLISRALADLCYYRSRTSSKYNRGYCFELL